MSEKVQVTTFRSSKVSHHKNKNKIPAIICEHELINGICGICGFKVRYKRNYEYNKDIGKTIGWRRLGIKITLAKYYQILEEQGEVCAICHSKSTDGKDLSVDHCHETGKVRGLLCNICNRNLVGKNITVQKLLAAADYLIGYDLRTKKN